MLDSFDVILQASHIYVRHMQWLKRRFAIQKRDQFPNFLAFLLAHFGLPFSHTVLLFNSRLSQRYELKLAYGIHCQTTNHLAR